MVEVFNDYLFYPYVNALKFVQRNKKKKKHLSFVPICCTPEYSTTTVYQCFQIKNNNTCFNRLLSRRIKASISFFHTRVLTFKRLCFHQLKEL